MLSGAGELLRWEEIRGNRFLCPKSSILIEFIESDASMIFRAPRRHNSSYLRVQNERKCTDEVIKVTMKQCRSGAARAHRTKRCGWSTRPKTQMRSRVRYC